MVGSTKVISYLYKTPLSIVKSSKLKESVTAVVRVLVNTVSQIVKLFVSLPLRIMNFDPAGISLGIRSFGWKEMFTFPITLSVATASRTLVLVPQASVLIFTPTEKNNEFDEVAQEE